MFPGIARMFAGKFIIYLVTGGIVLAFLGSLFGKGYYTGKHKEARRENAIKIKGNERRQHITDGNNRSTAEDEIVVQRQIKDAYEMFPDDVAKKEEE